MTPIIKTSTVTSLKKTNKYEGIVSYMWYLSEWPSLIFPSNVKIKFSIPSKPTNLFEKYLLVHRGQIKNYR